MVKSELMRYMLENGLKAAIEAGRAIMDIYNNEENYNVNLKSDNTIIIEADRVSHETIRKHLSKTRVPLMSEEGRDISLEERYGWDLYWLVDPIDGTLEFVRKSKEFSICIALVEDNNPVLGIIVAPAFGQIYYAVKGFGAYRIDNFDFSRNEEYNISKLREGATHLECNKSNPTDELEVLVTLSNPNKETDNIVEKLRARYSNLNRRECGSALKFCRMAEGAAHLYFRTTALKDWDTAAGEVIALESGLSVTSLSDKPLVYNSKDLVIEPVKVYFSNIL